VSLRSRIPDLLVLLAGLCTCPLTALAQDSWQDLWSFGGHAKYQFAHTRIPDNSILQTIDSDALQGHNLEARLKASARKGRWGLDMLLSGIRVCANWYLQFITMYSDMLAGSAGVLAPLLPASDLINDNRRWFDLTHEISNNGEMATLLRLDRASVGYVGDKTVLRFGRQAISWGSGLLFTPMDIFNPFDPSAVDKEYKAGDDMLYGL